MCQTIGPRWAEGPWYRPIPYWESDSLMLAWTEGRSRSSEEVRVPVGGLEFKIDFQLW